MGSTEDGGTEEVSTLSMYQISFYSLAAVGIIVNSLVILLFFHRPSLRSSSNKLVINQCACNFICSTNLMLSEMLSAKKWLWTSVLVMACFNCSYSILAIAADRYKAVFDPLRYNSITTRSNAKITMSAAFITIIWFGSVLMAFPAYILRQTNNDSISYKTNYWILGITVQSLYAILVVLVCYIIPVFTLLFFYFRMYCAAHKNSKRTRRRSVCLSSTNSYDSRRILTRRNSNAIFSILLLKEEGRAMKTCMLVIGSYLFSWTPFFLYYLQAAVQQDISADQDNGLYSVKVCALSSSLLNPIVYVFLNRMMRKEGYNLMLCHWARRQSKVTSIVHSPHEASAVDRQKRRSSSFMEAEFPQEHFIEQCDHVNYVESYCNEIKPLVPIDFVATYNPVSGGDESKKYESVTFRLVQPQRTQCRICSRQNSTESSYSNTTTCTPLLDISSRRKQLMKERSGGSTSSCTNDSITVRTESSCLSMSTIGNSLSSSDYQNSFSLNKTSRTESEISEDGENDSSYDKTGRRHTLIRMTAIDDCDTAL